MEPARFYPCCFTRWFNVRRRCVVEIALRSVRNIAVASCFSFVIFRGGKAIKYKYFVRRFFLLVKLLFPTFVRNTVKNTYTDSFLFLWCLAPNELPCCVVSLRKPGEQNPAASHCFVFRMNAGVFRKRKSTKKKVDEESRFVC